MKTYLAGQQVVFSVPLVDSEGVVFLASAASYRVLDETGNVLLGPTVINPWLGTETAAAVTIPGVNNTLAGALVRGLRQVEVTFTTAGGTILLVDGYIIEATEPLAVPTTSFTTYGNALLVGASMPNLESWGAASRADRVSSLMAARDNLCAMSYRWEALQDPMRWIEPNFAVQRLDLLDADEFIALSPEFRVALAQAQVIQADHLLGGDGVTKWRDKGIFAMTIGESKQMFRPGVPLNLPVCAAALRVIGRYVDYSIRVGRN
jgi:hypothetical protein